MSKGKSSSRKATGKGLAKLGISSLVVATMIGSAAIAGAATFKVNQREDAPDINPGDGICSAGLTTINPKTEQIRERLANCTLRAAIMEANALPGADKILLGWGKYPLTRAGYGAETAGYSGDLDIVDKLQIEGQGKNRTIIDATGLANQEMSPQGDRIFDIHGPGVVMISGMTLIGGNAMGGPREYYNYTRQEQNVEPVCPVVKPEDEADGGAILNRGAIAILTDMHFEDNQALCDGGAVENVGDGIMTIKNCDFAYNTAIGNGGAVENDEDSIMSIATADFKWNNAMENGGAVASDDSMLFLTAGTMTYNSARGLGGGVWNGDSDVMTMKRSNITYNDAADGGGIFNNDGFLNLRSNIVEYNSPNDIVDQQIPEDLP